MSYLLTCFSLNESLGIFFIFHDPDSFEKYKPVILCNALQLGIVWHFLVITFGRLHHRSDAEFISGQHVMEGDCQFVCCW